MRTVLFYYSATGNTELICSKIKKAIPAIELIDILKEKNPPTDEYDLYGFAIPAYYLSIPPVMGKFINSLEGIKGKPVFAIISYGMMSGKSMLNLKKSLKNKGSFLIDHHILRMPESYPPYIIKNLSDLNAPNDRELEGFGGFIRRIKENLVLLQNGDKIKAKNVNLGFWDRVIPAPSGKKIMKQFGKLYVNKDLCIECKKCFTLCSYSAISHDKYPVFDMNLCRGCYACFNNCPQNAIHTDMLKINKSYKGPNNKLKEKFI